MGFWHLPSTEPARKYRFKMSSPSSPNMMGDWYWAKSVSKPSYSVGTSEYLLINHKFKYPGVLTWSDISITIVDDKKDEKFGGQAGALISNLKSMYDIPTETFQEFTGRKYVPATDGGALTHFLIEQLNSSGMTVETWTLHDAFVKSVNFGDLSFSDDGLVEITIDISYDYASFASPNENN